MNKNILRWVFFILFIGVAVVLPAADFFQIVEKGDPDAIRLAIEKNPMLLKEKNSRGDTVLHIVSRKKHAELVEYLLKKGADPNDKNKYAMTPLTYAADAGNLNIVLLLIRNGGAVNAFSPFFGTPLHRSVYSGHFDVMKALLENGAEIHHQNSTGTALHTAAIMGRVPFADLLLQKGAQVDARNRQGLTPLFYAITTGKPEAREMAELLIGNGADVNARDKKGESVLMKSVRMGLPAVTDKLIQKGADIKQVCQRTGNSLLHVAAVNGYGDVTEILIRNGADVQAKNFNGKTPLFYAAQYGNKKAADILKKAGGKSGKPERNYGDSVYLKKELKEGEAYIWLLKNRGYLVRTKNHIFIFDNEETGRKPDEPSVDNGFYSLSELKDHKVIALYSAYHARENTMEFIHAYEDQLPKITYLHYTDDRWRGGKKSLYLKGGETRRIYGAEITVIETHMKYGMGSLGYRVKADGITFFYSTFPSTLMEEYRKAVDSIAGDKGNYDLAFIMAMPEEGLDCGRYILDKLKPRAVLPMGHSSTHSFFKEFVDTLMASHRTTSYGLPVHPGDRFHYLDGRLTPSAKETESGKNK